MISGSSALLAVIFICQFYGDEAVCCPAGGIWSEWTNDLRTCYDYCGGAGMMNRTRFCVTASQGCPCVGNANEVAPCDNTPCIYPRNWSCSPNKTLSGAGGRFQCLAQGESGVDNTTLPPPTACESCPSAGIWGEWRDVGTPCSATCGACGKINRTRTCLSAPYGCNCRGNIWELQNCARTPCVGSSSECCLSSTKQVVNGTALCVDNFAPAPIVVKRQAAICFSPWGIWNDWSSWSTCSATCGLCGTRTRTRTCASEPYGCPCTGNTNQTQLCGFNGCPGATPCCGGNFNVTTYDGATICMPVKPFPVATPGAWTAYTPISGKTCNDTCGGWGQVSSYRFCLPHGSSCGVGKYFDNAPCGFSICPFPRTSCAPEFMKYLDTPTQTFSCVPRSNTTTTTAQPV